MWDLYLRDTISFYNFLSGSLCDSEFVKIIIIIIIISESDPRSYEATKAVEPREKSEASTGRSFPGLVSLRLLNCLWDWNPIYTR